MKTIILLLLIFTSYHTSSSCAAIDTVGDYAAEYDGNRVIVADSVDPYIKPSQVYRLINNSNTHVLAFRGLDNTNEFSLPYSQSIRASSGKFVVIINGQDVTFRLIGG